MTQRRSKYLIKQISIEVIAFSFIVLFAYAAMNKSLDFKTFQIQMGQSPLLLGLQAIVPWFVIISEACVTIMLAIAKTRLLGLYGSLSLMTMFSGYIIAILNFSDFVPCSCGGILEKLGWTEHLTFNIAIMVLAIVGIFLETDRVIGSYHPNAYESSSPS